MEFPPPDRHDRISRTCSLLPAARSNRCTGLLPSCPQQSFRPTQHKSLPAQKYIPRQPRDHIKKASSQVPFCLGKMVRSDRLECGRKSEVKETAWWEGRSVWIGKGVPDYPQKAGSAAEALRGRLQPGSRSKRDFLRKRRNGAQSIPMWDRRSV